MRLLVRADTDPRAGIGHVMRCLALAQAWQDEGGEAVFAASEPPAAIVQRLQQDGIAIIDAPLDEPADWTVVDGYGFDAAFQDRLTASGRRVLWIDDDAHAEHYTAALVLNQNLHARAESYAKRSPATRLLLGPRYALLRREFRRLHAWTRDTRARARRVLVTLGGADVHDVTSLVVDALQQLDDCEAVVVIGNANRRFNAARALAAHIRIERDVSAMSERMTWADVCIAASGSTSWELAFMQLPALLIVTAANQERVAEHVAVAGAAINLGWYDKLDADAIARELRTLLADGERRAEMACRGRRLVDGDGALRVVNAMRARSLQLRRATDDDCRLIWQWANDPVVRQFAFTTEPIPWETHLAWWNARDGQRQLFIAMDDGRPAGQARFDIENHTATITISIDAAARGRGYGSAVIAMSTEELFASTDVARVDAFIRPENASSIKAFLAAGFVEQEMTTVKGIRALRLSRTR